MAAPEASGSNPPKQITCLDFIKRAWRWLTSGWSIFLVVNLTIFLINILAFGSAVVWDGGLVVTEFPHQISVLQVMITATVIILAVLSFFGFNTIRDLARDTAKNVAKQAANDEAKRVEERLRFVIDTEFRKRLGALRSPASDRGAKTPAGQMSSGELGDEAQNGRTEDAS